MNKSALKTFATSARKELLKKVEAKAMKIGITEDNIKKADIESSDAIFIDGRQLLREEKTQRDKLITRINQIGFKQVMEEVAYTWFNRFTALRFMEVNDYLPTGVRVLSSSNPNSADPDMINEALELDLEIELDREYIYNLKLNNETEELFKYLIIKHCNELNRFLPFMFETIDDYTEILFPEGLLAKDSFIRQMTDIDFIQEDNWKRVEIIGWLYQFYIAEEKDRVFKAKKKYKSEEIPYATQLFTPDWIVRYMVQNSLGRYWVESHPEQRELFREWEFYIENPDSEVDFEEELAPYINKELKVEDIKCIDPAMGSGHILVYMFDVLYEIYIKCGYMEREIPRLIIENNLYGLDIDDRAYQLACFSVVMKALEYNSRFLRSIEREGLELKLISIQETNHLTEADIAYISGEESGEIADQMKSFISQFKDAKTIGSLLNITLFPKELVEIRYNQIKINPVEDLFQVELREKSLLLLPQLIKQAQILTNQYDILVTNPPYMGIRYMTTTLVEYLNQNYPDTKNDLFAPFMELNHLLKDKALMSFINQHSWMFTFSYEKLRKKIITTNSLVSMLHLGTRAFEDIGGEIVQTTSFTLRNYHIPKSKGIYLRLTELRNAKEKRAKTLESIEGLEQTYIFKKNQKDFLRIQGYPLGYWLSDKAIEIFSEGEKLKDIGEPKSGIMTGNNDEFLKMWTEVNVSKIGFKMRQFSDINYYKFKWFPYFKGGSYRKWYGNMEYLINMENEGYDIKYSGKNTNYRLRDSTLYFKEGINWSDVATNNFSVRYSPPGFLFDMKGSSVFIKNDVEYNVFYVLALLASKIIGQLIQVLNPTMSFQVNDLERLPIVKANSKLSEQIINISKENVELAKEDWDSFERSWDFKLHPLLFYKEQESLLKNVWMKYKIATENRFFELKRNEEEINQYFIDLYGLVEEITPDIQEKDVIIYRADIIRDIKSFISYVIGCMFGRYSLDEQGLVYAGGEFKRNKYQTYPVDEDNIVPILPESYFEDDIVSRFSEFIQATYGKETLAENLDFIAETLGNKKGETAKETIRRYFLNEFFKDHVQTYKNRPIYWLFTSGKQKAFNCLIYMHRYDKTTLSRIRTDYLHEYQIRLDAEKKDLLSIIEGDYSTKEISNAKKELKVLDKKIDELKEYDELLHHMADMQIEIDLDDGVVQNYEMFEGLVVKI
ncbi:BREX-1 system adenine-specific DNA-methyltransferase PglX [Neobacillus sp. D3-1R]|uniref:BREX-1 system adenine-specific DNA-methyltransferase PglX n=1 Tax=Neobacillus sp. D3-1R TaxID=3445778 RepID=UPI003F9FB334